MTKPLTAADVQRLVRVLEHLDGRDRLKVEGLAMRLAVEAGQRKRRETAPAGRDGVVPPRDA